MTRSPIGRWAIGNLEPQLGKEIHRVFGAAIDFGMALLPPVAFDLAHGHAVDADAGERFAHFVEFERLDDSDDHFCMNCPAKLNGLTGVSAVTNESRPASAGTDPFTQANEGWPKV